MLQESARNNHLKIPACSILCSQMDRSIGSHQLPLIESSMNEQELSGGDNSGQDRAALTVHQEPLKREEDTKTGSDNTPGLSPSCVSLPGRDQWYISCSSDKKSALEMWLPCREVDCIL